jgi:hypothetical protein
MRFFACLMILLGVVTSTGCQGSSIDLEPPSQIISAPTTPLPAARESPTVNPSWTRTPALTVVTIPEDNPEIIEETPTMNEVPIPTPLDPGLEKIVIQAKDDLSQRLAIDPGQIELYEVASVTWPDGSLGCPQPGMMYTQVQVDGLLIRFRVEGRIFEYHSGEGQPPFLCE